MKNMKVSMKLIVSFLIIAGMATIVGIVGIYGLTQLEAKDTELYESNLVAIAAMADFREAYQMERVQLRELILAIGDKQAVDKAYSNFAQYEQTIKAAMEAYEKTITNEADEKGYLDAKKVYLGDFTTMKGELYNIALTGTVAQAQEKLEEIVALAQPLAAGLQQAATQNNTWGKETVDSNSRLATILIVVQVVVLLIAVATALAFAFYISGLISKPLLVLTKFMGKAGKEGDISLSQEDREAISKYAQIKDEIGQCIASTSVFVEHLTVVAEELGMIAGGDLTVKVECLSDKDVMGVALLKMADSLNSMFTEIRNASDQVSSGAEQVSQGAQQLASGSSEQAASIEELSASLSELQEKTDHNADDSSKARDANNKTAEKLEGSIRSMGQMLDAMRAINESSSSITKVIKVIDDIAFQTNILALNAAVEAARAGQHGKGFAVVADEVRNLAAKSAEAAKETSSLIEGSTERVKEGNEIVEKTNADLEAAVQNAQESTRLIEQVANASLEQARSITEINQGMEQISTVVQANSATAEQSAAASEEMSAQSVVMNEVVARFRLRNSDNSSRSSGMSSKPSSGGYVESTGFAMSGSKY